MHESRKYPVEAKYDAAGQEQEIAPATALSIMKEESSEAPVPPIVEKEKEVDASEVIPSFKDGRRSVKAAFFVIILIMIQLCDVCKSGFPLSSQTRKGWPMRCVLSVAASALFAIFIDLFVFSFVVMVTGKPGGARPHHGQRARRRR